jgi:GNAT superfamily N-acetyltransferase
MSELNDEYAYRLAKVSDSVAISSLILEVVEEFVIPEFTPRGAENMRAIISEPCIKSYIEQGMQYYLASYCGEIVGALAIKNGFHIYHFFVSKAHQKKKVAYSLWRYWFTNNPQPRVTVNSSKFAMAFYRSLGFTQHQPMLEFNGIKGYPMVRDRVLD